MRPIVKAHDCDVWLSQLERPFEFSSPFEQEEFALLLVVIDETITDKEQTHLSEEIVRQGCRYAVCYGHKCSIWHDSIDWAYLATEPDFAPSDEHFVMTTWHEHESLEDVVQFLRFGAFFDVFWPKHYLVLILGGESKTVNEVSSYLKEWFI